MPAPAVAPAPAETSGTTIAEAAAADPDAVPGDGSLVCPDDFPVKGNASSKIYHLPGTSYYAMTKAGICFRSPEAAERAGFRASKSSPIRSATSTDPATTTTTTTTLDGEGSA
jgi:large subunit ribosomal protein L17